MVGAWIVVLAMLIVVQCKLLFARIPKANHNVAIAFVNRDNGVFVDIRSQELFQQGHIANAINVTFSDIKEGKTNRIDGSKDKPVILVGKDRYDSECFNGGRFLKKQGFTKIYTLDGGMSEWINANLPLSHKK